MCCSTGALQDEQDDSIALNRVFNVQNLIIISYTHGLQTGIGN